MCNLWCDNYLTFQITFQLVSPISWTIHYSPIKPNKMWFWRQRLKGQDWVRITRLIEHYQYNDDFECRDWWTKICRLISINRKIIWTHAIFFKFLWQKIFYSLKLQFQITHWPLRNKHELIRNLNLKKIIWEVRETCAWFLWIII